MSSSAQEQQEQGVQQPVADPAAAAVVAKAERLMLITSVATFIALAVVLGLVGYRVSHSGDNATILNAAIVLPKGAKVISTAVTSDRIAVTIELDGATQVRLFDPKTLKPVGRFNFTVEP
jgi:hypothetical protein